MEPQITIAVPSMNQGRFLDAALASIFSQNVEVEVFVLDGGSTDDSVSIIEKWQSRLAGWRSGPDAGQAAAINEGIAQGTAPYVAWLNADDIYLPGGLAAMLAELEGHPETPAVYTKCWTIDTKGNKTVPYLTAPFRPWLLANFCFIAQPATLMRRSAWEKVGGLDGTLHMAMDYDLWWRLYHHGGPLRYLKKFTAGTRMHGETKTAIQRKAHYQEAMAVVNKHYGRIPLKWYAAWPFMVTLRSLGNRHR